MPPVTLPSPEILSHVTDAHCHPTDNAPSASSMTDLKIKICAMASRRDDQVKVKDLAQAWPEKVVPFFGWHPWHSHTISLVNPPPTKIDHYTQVILSGVKQSKQSEQSITILEELLPNLPDPISLDSVIDELRANLTDLPNSQVGEVGIDRAFRIPFVPYPGPPNTARKLSPFTVPIDHQLAVLEAQIDLAIELKRAVSFHSVKGQQITLDLLKRLRAKYGAKFGEISIDLHSCGFSAESWLEVERLYPNVFLSLSVAINARSSGHEALIRACSPTRILAESDYPEVGHSTEMTWQMVCTIADIKGWKVETEYEDEGGVDEQKWGVVRRLETNFNAFIKGGLGISPSRETHRERQLKKLDEWESGSDDA